MFASKMPVLTLGHHCPPTHSLFFKVPIYFRATIRAVIHYTLHLTGWIFIFNMRAVSTHLTLCNKCNLLFTVFHSQNKSQSYSYIRHPDKLKNAHAFKQVERFFTCVIDIMQTNMSKNVKRLLHADLQSVAVESSLKHGWPVRATQAC